VLDEAVLDEAVFGELARVVRGARLAVHFGCQAFAWIY
jgi:hypothetical protein